MIDIIVEGPDGSGKSTFIKEITAAFDLPHFERASTSAGGPVDNLADWTEKHLRSIPGPGKPHVLDRHPLISEPIYGPIVRQMLPFKFDNRHWLRDQTHILSTRAVVVWCMPPVDRVAENVLHGVQMPGVTEHILRIYWAYHTTMARWPGYSMMHNYTEPDSLARALRFVEGVVRHPYLYRGNCGH